MTDPDNRDARTLDAKARASLARIEAERAPKLIRKFYTAANLVAVGDGWGLVLDDKPLRTPARARLTVPVRAIAERIAGEWNAQTKHINPAVMPLTRLAVSALDQVAGNESSVRDQISSYAASDLILYRADAPDGLVARQCRQWDPILAWAKAEFQWQFEPVCGVIHKAQPAPTLKAFCHSLEPASPLLLSAMFSITTLTGSALISRALASRALSADVAWSAAHVDEDWQMSRWGDDSEAQQHRDKRAEEFNAACAVIELLSAVSRR